MGLRNLHMVHTLVAHNTVKTVSEKVCWFGCNKLKTGDFTR